MLPTRNFRRPEPRIRSGLKGLRVTALLVVFAPCAMLPDRTVFPQAGTATTPAAGVASGTSDAGAIVDRLLGELWERTGPELLESKALVDTALASHAGDHDLVYAAALNSARHYRFRDVARILRTHAAGSRRVETWILRTWCELATGQHNACLVGLRDAKRMVTGPGSSPDAAALESFYRHCGRVFGFLQGPVQGHANADLLRDTIALVADGATPELLALMNGESQQVLDDFEALSKDHAAATAQFLQEAAVKGAAEAQRIDATNQQLAARRDQVQPELERLKMEANAQLSALNQQASPLLAEAAALEASCNQQAWTLNNIRGEILYLQQALAIETDPVIRFPLIARLNQLYALARSAEYELAAVRARLAGIQSQLNVLGMQQNQVTQTYSVSIGQGEAELQQIARDQRRNARRLEQIAEGPRQVTGPALSLKNRLDLLSTYYVLPLDLYRLNLRDELAARR